MGKPQPQYPNHGREPSIVGQPQRRAAIADTQLYSQEAEEAVIGAVLINPDMFATVAELIKPEDFYLLRNAYIWQAISRLDDRNEPIDYLTVIAELKNMGWLDELGGPAYITQLVNSTPTSMHAQVYAEMVQRIAVRRRMLAAADEIKVLAADESQSTMEIIAESENRLLAATEGLKTQTITPISRAIAQNMDALEAKMANPSPHTGIPTGIDALDKMLGGFRNGRLYFVGGRTHMGKTSCMGSMAIGATIAGARTIYVTLEETEDDLTNRLLAMEMNINKDQLDTGNLTAAQYSRYVEVCGRFAQRPLWIDARTEQLTPRGLYNLIKIQQYATGVDLVFVDYLGLMSAGPLDANGVYEKTSYLCGALQRIVRLLRIPLVVGIQNHRDSRQRPTLKDFEGSGRIEQVADVAMLLYREGYYKTDAPDPDKAEIIVAKNKINGCKGTVFAYSNPVSFRFSDWQGMKMIGR